MNDIKNLSAAQMGHLLTGFGVNLLVRGVPKTAEFLHSVFDFQILRQSADYAVLKHRQQLYQLHVDATYANNPLLACLPEQALRGAGVELRLYEVDPEQAERRAREYGYEVLQATTNKPHGLRECYLLDPDGYCWVPSQRY